MRRLSSRGAAAFACALVLGGCGGGSEPAASESAGPTASESAGPTEASSPAPSLTPPPSPTGVPAPVRLPVDLPEAKGTLSSAAEDFAAAVRTGECALSGTFVTARQRDPQAEPGSAPDAKECAELQRFLAPLAAFTPTAHQEFGTAAVVDGELGGTTVTTLWLLDPDGRWRIDPTAYVRPTADDPDVASVGTAPPEGNRFLRNAKAWVKAWRAGECVQVFRLTDPFSGFVTANGGTADGLCRVVTASFDAEGGIGRILVANPSAVPEPLGAVDQYGFSLLRAKDGSLFTIVSIVAAPNLAPAQRAAHEDFGVYNVYRSGTASGSAPSPAPTVSPTAGSKASPTAQPSGRPHSPS